MSNFSSMVSKVRTMTGLRSEEVRVALNAIGIAMREEVLEGRNVVLDNFGVFYFRVAKARTMPERMLPNGKIFKKSEIPERYILKFRTNSELRKMLKGVEPNQVRKAAKWSDKRKSNPSPSSENSASTSNRSLGEAGSPASL